MTRYAVFLRGVNVGGVNIRMADLREALVPLRVSNVSTILASGNLLVESDLSIAELKSTIESTLRTRFGYDAWVVVMTQTRVAELAVACPFPADDRAIHAYVTLASDTAALDALSSTAGDRPGADLVRLGPEAIAWTAPVGATLETPLSKLMAATKYKRTTTTRNLRTLIKVGSEVPSQ